MSAITATNSTTLTLQSLLGETRLQQARQDANQAESHAKQLRNQADQAERSVQVLRNQADQAEQNAKKSQQAASYLSAQQLQQNNNTVAQSPASPSQVPAQTQNLLINLYQSSSSQFAASGNALKSSSAPPAVVNTQGQTTGRIVNLTA